MDSLCVRGGIHGLMGPAIVVNSGPDRPHNNGPNQFSAVGRAPAAAATTNAILSEKTPTSLSTSLSSKFSAFNYPFKSLFFGGGKQQQRSNNKGVALDDAVLVKERENDAQLGGGVGGGGGGGEGQNGNWVMKILHVRSLWEEEERESVDQGQDGHFKSNASTSSSSSSCDHDDHDGDGCECDGCRVNDDDDENVEEFDRDSFTKLLKKVSLSQAKLYAQLSYLGNLAYDIPRIKPENLLKRHGMRYVISSIEKRELLAEAEKKEQLTNAEGESQEGSEVETAKGDDQNNEVRTSAAYQIAASAASYLHSRTRAILPSRSSKDEEGDSKSGHRSSDSRSINSEMASLMATTDSVTAVVAAKEEVKQAVADDLNSISSSPCEWFVCDDEKSATRFFVVQGSETLASWQANLLFEPMQFEGLDVFVHRGIYEAAKGMYQQMLPEVLAFMKTHGSRAKFRFTGHSLGGSLSLLINLMLLMRGEVPYASLLPVITFGSPCIMCGGDELLRKLALPKSHVQAIVMHRDIVPRAFSCNYPRPAAQLLKAVNGSFRNHPCLNSQKLLYAPMGEMIILQPDPKFSPQHDLLPSGSGLYLLTCKVADAIEAEKQLRAAKNTFLNMPHPLEILSDRSAYGSGGTIQRDHDMNSYLKCVRGVIRQELSRVRKAERERRRKVWWPLLKPRVIETGIVVGTTLTPTTGGSAQFKFAGALRTGKESLKRFSRLVASQHMHLLVVLLFPARLLLIGAYSMIPR